MAEDTPTETRANEISSLSRGFEILELIKDLEEVTVNEVAEVLDIPWSTAHVYLQTLVKSRFVVRDGTDYRLSHRFLSFGGERRQQMAIYETSRSEIDTLAQETGEVVDLGVEERGQRVLLYKSEGEEGIYDNPPIGEYTNMHWTALGKALLAEQSDDRIEAIVSNHGLPRATENTITDRDRLFEEVETIRENGYAVENQERRLGIKGIAAPIVDQSSSDVLGALSISGPQNRFRDDRLDDLREKLSGSINIIELEYSYY